MQSKVQWRSVYNLQLDPHLNLDGWVSGETQGRSSGQDSEGGGGHVIRAKT